MLPIPWFEIKSDVAVPPIRGAPYVYRSAAMPLFLRSAAARAAIAPPKLCPTTTTLELGCEAAVASSAARTPFRASSHESQKPRETLQVSQRSGAGIVGNLTSVMKLRTDLEPRKARTVRSFVASTAM